MAPAAPNESWMPFWAMCGVGPRPVTRFRRAVRFVPIPLAVMPFFW